MRKPPTTSEADDIRFQLRDVVAGQIVDEADGTASLDDHGIEVITAAVDALLDTSALMDGVDAILVLGHWLEVHMKSPACAKRLVDIVNRESVLESMKRVHLEAQDQTKDRARKGADDFNKFAQRAPTIEKAAADPDGETPSNAVKLNDLSFPKRL